MVDLSNLPGELTGTQTELTLYRFSQYYDPESDIEMPLLTGRKKQKTADATPEENEIAEKSQINKKIEQSPIANILPTASTYNNCTFVFNIKK